MSANAALPEASSLGRKRGVGETSQEGVASVFEIRGDRMPAVKSVRKSS